MTLNKRHAMMFGTPSNPGYLLDNRLQIPRVAQSILDHLVTGTEDVLLACQQILVLLREIDTTILDYPVARLGELHHCAFGVEEEEVLGVGDGDGGVGFLGAGGDLVADGVD